MNGSIGVNSELNEGSRFWVDCVLNPNNVTSINTTRYRSAKFKSGNKKTVLYVEDNPANLRLVEQILETIPDLHMWSAPEPLLGLDWLKNIFLI